MTLLIRNSIRLLLAVFVLGALADLVALSYPIVLQHLVDSVGAHLTWDFTDHILAFVLILTVGGAVVTLGRDLLATFLCGRVDLEATGLLMAKIVGVPLGVLRGRSSGDWLVAIQQIQELKAAVGMLGTQALFDVLLVFGYVAVLAHYDVVAAASYVVASVAILGAMSLMSRVMYGAVERGYAEKARAETYVMEALRSPLLVRAFGLGSWARQRWAAPYRESVREFQKADYLSGVFGAVFLVVRQAAPLLVLAWKLPAVSRGQVTFGEAFALSTVFGLGFDPLLKISAMLSQLQKIVISYRATRELFTLPEESHLATTERVASAGLPAVAALTPPSASALVVENLMFSYPGAPIPTLFDVNVSIEAGQRIALVGHSGSGKSTIFQLLTGLQRASGGGIRIDGRPIETIPLESLRRDVALVAQDTELFTGTILENIALGDAAPDLERAREAARLSGVAGVIEEMPDGYGSMVGEGGCTLSAGQRQRVAIARALYRRPKLLLLDEPTSALDALTERELSERLPEICRGRTVIVAAHKLESIRGFDGICVLERGRLVEFGTHDELVAKRARYWALWSALGSMQEKPIFMTGGPIQ